MATLGRCSAFCRRSAWSRSMTPPAKSICFHGRSNSAPGPAGVAATNANYTTHKYLIAERPIEGERLALVRAS